jgi:hypothetical protein
MTSSIRRIKILRRESAVLAHHLEEQAVPANLGKLRHQQGQGLPSCEKSAYITYKGHFTRNQQL